MEGTNSGPSDLLLQIERLKKINAALMARVERSAADRGSAYSLFEGNVLLEKKVKERTRQLRSKNIQIAEEKNKLNILIQTIAAQQTQIVNASRLSALGEMAGGIAHEINTPLGIILVLANYLEKHCSGSDFDIEKIQDCSQRISKSVLKISKIVDSLLSVARGGEDEKATVLSADELVKEALELCRPRFIEKSVPLIYNSDFDIQMIGKKVQFTQVLINLLKNALHAALEQADPWVKVEVVKAGDVVRIYIVDSGNGVAPEIVAKMFDPFFTTKEIGLGTGLGLSLSKQIMDSAGGRLGYELVSGHTAFFIEI